MRLHGGLSTHSLWLPLSAVRRGGWGVRPQRFHLCVAHRRNLLQHTFQILFHAFILKPYDPHPRFLNLPMANAVLPSRAASVVDFTIQFNRHFGLRAVEIRDVMRAERVLAAEFQSIETACAETLPELVLDVGGVPSKFARQFDQRRVEAAEGTMDCGVGWERRLRL